MPGPARGRKSVRVYRSIVRSVGQPSGLTVVVTPVVNPAMVSSPMITMIDVPAGSVPRLKDSSVSVVAGSTAAAVVKAATSDASHSAPAKESTREVGA